MATTQHKHRNNPLHKQTFLSNSLHNKRLHNRPRSRDLTRRTTWDWWTLLQYIWGYEDSCEELHSDTVKFIIAKCRRLRRLSFKRFINLTDALLGDVVSHLTALEYLDLSIPLLNIYRLVLWINRQIHLPNDQPTTQTNQPKSHQMPKHNRWVLILPNI